MFFFPQVEPNTKLFPAVFVRPTSADLFQFEFVKMKVCCCFYLILTHQTLIYKAICHATVQVGIKTNYLFVTLFFSNMFWDSGYRGQEVID